jgi:hypothetical protein
MGKPSMEAQERVWTLHAITLQLRQWGAGDHDAHEKLIPLSTDLCAARRNDKWPAKNPAISFKPQRCR